MKLPHNLLLSATLYMCIMGKEDVDFIDTESTQDKEAAQKCDVGTIVARKFVDAFSELKEEAAASSQMPHDEDIINAAESVCDDAWEGFHRNGRSAKRNFAALELTAENEEETVWSRRLQDMCDELNGR
ncbi:uncharacterized protein LOC126992403, partial [Eriocheir sinensis]|uniref:uncharacterized protein LOC126992403 n=1 Tax=Eriocheir sinensis TaxID=95602 RepID=UPI0021C9FED2